MPGKEIISTDKAPKVIGPYSAGIRAGNFIFTAGQLGIDPKSGKFAPGGAVAQTRQALLNLTAVLEAVGASLDQVVKTTVFLADMDDYGPVNEVYGEFFNQDPPARSAVQVARLPKDALVEIEAVAFVGG
jgi:2-iminobutanoate/2-iminopropanoate deaminase